ncbi:MAG: hypothetical protein KKD28_14555 [Chloroflexi bacterium]|nr:hypothetical protein [Chloroflexota bacterium]
MGDSRWRMAGGGWRVADGGWRVADRQDSWMRAVGGKRVNDRRPPTFMRNLLKQVQGMT